MNILQLISSLFGHRKMPSEVEDPNVMKYLIACLGNIGAEYDGTRHNIGFRVADALAEAAGATFEDHRYGFVSRFRVKNAELVVLKPSTYMNLSGNAVRYWMQKENVPVERLLVVCDDLSLPFGKLRMRQGGADGGHNGLKHIAQVLSTQTFARLRFGIGNDFPRGGQVDFVLGHFSDDDLQAMPERIALATDAVRTFCLAGVQTAMNQYNNK